MPPPCSFVALLVLALPLTGVAQGQVLAPPVPRFFVGLSGSFGGYPLPAFPPGGRSGTNVASAVPTVGVQVRPRLAVELSAAYDREHTAYALTYGADPRAPDRYQARASRLRTLVVPVLARYTLTRPRRHRFQADALGGVSLVHATRRGTVVTMEGAVAVAPPLPETARATAGCLTLGGGARYALWPRLELTAEAVLNRLVTSGPPALHWANPNLTAGLRYRFGQTL